MDKVKLHRCSWTFLRTDLHPCWKVERRLKAAGIPYETVKHGYGKGGRGEIQELTQQQKLPVIEFADGTAYRSESSDMAERIEAGRLFQSQTSGP